MARRGNNEGSIYQTADGRWRAALSLGGGKRKLLSGATRAEVARKLTSAQRDRDRGIPVARDERQTVATYLASWLDTIRPPVVRSSTWTRYEQLCRLHITPALGRISLARLGAQQINALYASKLAEGLSARTVVYVHATLHKSLQDAIETGLLARNVAEAAKPPRRARRKEMRTFTPEEARRFLAAIAGDRLEALYVLALTSGMREGELLSLRWPDVDLDGGFVSVRRSLSREQGVNIIHDPKTEHGRRRIAINALAADHLRRHHMRQFQEIARLAEKSIPWPDDSQLVFTDGQGHPLVGTTVYRYRFLPILRRAGLPLIRFHDLRHTAATLMMLAGVPAKVVAEMLGHASVAITLNLYSHVQPGMQRDAADAMDRLLGSR